MPSLLRRCLAALRVPTNEVGFAVRSRLRWSRGEPSTAVTANERILAANAALGRHLEALAGDLAMPCGDDGVVRAIDVGCGDFHYAAALARWLASHGAAARDVALRGIEVDGFGIYRDGHSRADHARAHAAHAATRSAGGGTVRFEVADFTRIRLPEQDVVSLFYPFLSAYPTLRWGLPLSRLRPRRLVARAVATVRPGGWLVVANQTAMEFTRLGELLAEQPVDLLRQVSFATDLGSFAAQTAGRVGSLWRRRKCAASPGGPW